MEYICVLDTETTGLDASKGKVLEIGAILYHIPSRSIISEASTLCYAEENPAYAINKIEINALKATSEIIEFSGIKLISEIMTAAHAIVAHNAEFDKRWVNNIPALENISRNKKWICTKNDVVWPIRKDISLSLITICAALGVPIINTHRAMSDCHLLLAAIEENDDVLSFLDSSGKGRIIYHAEISYENRQLAKDAGFRWDNVKKVWHAKLTQEQAEKVPFMVYPAESLESLT
jgi:DNA polymerase-3 subunit epsilon